MKVRDGSKSGMMSETCFTAEDWRRRDDEYVCSEDVMELMVYKQTFRSCNGKRS